MPKKIQILFIGDLMLGEWHFRQGFGISRLVRKGNFSQFFAPVQALFEESDLVVGNLEGPAGSPAESLKKPLMVNENFIPILKEAGIDVISVANNHLMEYGDDKAKNTIENLRKSGLKVSGLAETPSLTLAIGDKNIEIISADILPAHHVRKEYPAEPIMFSGNLEHIGEVICDRLDFSEADYRFVYLHWGEEYMFYPCPLQMRWAHRFIDHGADAVIGSHPHVPQGVEEYSGKIIAYSLGNFISDMPYPMTKEGYLISLEFGETAKIEYKIIPYRISDKFIPNPMNECEAKIFQDFMITELEKKEIKDGLAEDFQRYTIDAVNAENAMWDWVKGYYKRNIFRYPLYAQWGWIKEKLGI